MDKKNFAWIATWKITRRCNLHCVYCDHAAMLPEGGIEKIDYAAAIDAIARYAPKILNISGGEPTLVEELPWILSEVKRRWNPFIRVVHNGTCPERLVPSLPFLDRLVVSMDGPDPVNRTNRGLSAALVFEKLARMLPRISSANVALFINCVLTKDNLSYMREFAQKVRELSPSVTLSFTPVMPPDCGLSIVQDRVAYNEFLSTYRSLKKEGFSVMQVFDGIVRHAGYGKIQCYNQHFIIRVTPEGQVLSCAMNTPMNGGHYDYYFRKMFAKNGLKKALFRISQKARRAIFNTVEFSCNSPCACENWLDLLFLGLSGDALPVYARGLRGRLTEEDYKEAEAFVRKHINPAFKSEYLRKIVDPPQGDTAS